MEQPIRKSGPFPLDVRTRSLIWELSKREVIGRYRGMNLGVIWSLLQPFMMLGVYTVAFGKILRSRWPGADDASSFALILFVGLITHGFLAECLARGPTLVVGNTSYVKRIVFPLEILPWPVLLSGMFHLFANVLVLLVCLTLLGRPLHTTAILLPLVIAPLCLVALGSMWIFAALAVYFRDINQLMGPLVTSLFFVSSAIMPVTSIPERFRPIFYANPVTLIVDNAREVLLVGSMPHWSGLLLYTVLALTWMLVGYAIFSRLRKGFANVL